MIEDYYQVSFKEEFFELIRNGEKTQTMRIPPSRWDVEKEDIVLANFPGRDEKLLLEITDIGYKNFGSINDEDAKREGFSSAIELKHILETIYSGYPLEDYNRMYYFRFEVIGEISTIRGDK